MAGGEQQIDFRRPRPDARKRRSSGRSHRAASSRTDGRDRARRRTACGDRAAAPSASAATGRPRGTRPRRPRAAPSGVSGSTSLVKRPKMASRAGRRHLLRHDDRGEAVEARLGQPERHLVRPWRASPASRGSIRQSASSPSEISSMRGDAAHRCSCSGHRLESSNLPMRAFNPSSVSNEPAGLPLRAEPERRAASRPCAVGHAQQRMGGAHAAGGSCCASRTSTSTRCTPEFEQGIYRRPRLAGHRLGEAGAPAVRAFRRLQDRARPADRARNWSIPPS